MDLIDFVKPELLVVSAVLYFLGIIIKQGTLIKDKYIPLFLGIAGIVLCGIYIISVCPMSGGREISMAIFSAVTQGILVAGLSTYVNQFLKQMKKPE